MKTWLANQSKVEPILGVESSWIFSPMFHSENYVGRYDFFDFPNQFNPDKKIGPHVIDMTRQINLKFEVSSVTPRTEVYDCNFNKSDIEVKDSYVTGTPVVSVCDSVIQGELGELL